MVTTTNIATPAWTPTSHADYDRLKGLDVFSADGEKLGSIAAVFNPQPTAGVFGGHYFLVKPGALTSWFGGGEEVYVPEAAIAAVTDKGAVLGYDKETLEAEGWNRKPAGLDRLHRA